MSHTGIMIKLAIPFHFFAHSAFAEGNLIKELVYDNLLIKFNAK